MIHNQKQRIKTIKIATRKSELALWQATFVANTIKTIHPDIQVILVKRVSTGDKLLNTSLMKIGGKGLFTKELEHALLEGEADIAVHSMKDVPILLPSGFSIPVVCQREQHHDALISNSSKTLESLHQGAIIGTSSLRRTCQLLALRPDLNIKLLRGNVNTRLKRLDQGEYDAIILAYAGLKRLGLQHRVTEILSTEVCLPAAGQGAIGVELLTKRTDILEIIKPLHHAETALCIDAERTVNTILNASCHVPVASFARLEGQHIHLRALVGQPDGSKILRAEIKQLAKQNNVGKIVADMLLKQGAREILQS